MQWRNSDRILCFKVWSNSLCNMDSDQDGRTNGEELGDPSCIWTPGDIPSATTGLSHPGILDLSDFYLECSADHKTTILTQFEKEKYGLVSVLFVQHNNL